MNLIGKTLGALALSIVMVAAMLLLVGLAIWLLVPVAFPAVDLTYPRALGVAGLLYLVKAIYVVK
jgi:uncharacterized membrane protein (DUF485 family)